MSFTGGSANSTFLIDRFSISDTKVHSYRTDPNSIPILAIGDQRPALQAFSIWIHNTTDQVLTASVIGNIDGTGNYPDYTIDVSGAESIAVNPGDTQLIVYEMSRYATEYVSLQVQFATAPTKGYITAKVMIYQG